MFRKLIYTQSLIYVELEIVCAWEVEEFIRHRSLVFQHLQRNVMWKRTSMRANKRTNERTNRTESNRTQAKKKQQKQSKK